MKAESRTSTILLSIIVTILYGHLVVQVFTGFADPLELEKISWSFIMLLPYSLGMLGNYVGLQRELFSLKKAVVFPWLFCVAFVAFVAATVAVTMGAGEAAGMMFCMLIGLPIFLPAASVGGVTMWLIYQNKKLASLMLLLALMSPVFSGTVEARFDTDRATTTTATYIDIAASPETIWENITAVSPIGAGEHRPNWIHYLGFPRPMEATLSHEGVGGVRRGMFDSGLRFDETIVVWDEHRQLAFEITETSESLLPPPLDIIDNEQFDVIGAAYRLEPLGDGRTRLHLTSEHALKTRFNGYGGFWTNLVMDIVQDDILELVKARAEATQ